MLEEFEIHTIHIVGGTQKGMYNTQSRSKNNSNLTAIYITYIDRKWYQNEKRNENSPQDTKNSPQ